MSRIVSVVIPCYNEKLNIEVLVKGIFHADSSCLIKQVIVVDDDSPDGTAEYIKTQIQSPLPVICIHRINRQGLSSAVIEGVMLADTPFVAVMDGDGQHTPQDLLGMLNMLINSNADIIIGSRFKTMSAIDIHVGFRSVISKLGNKIANYVIDQNLTDPLTGFFIFKRDLFLQSVKIMHPMGFKILIEFLYSIKNKTIAIIDYPIAFKPRLAGESKLDSKVLLEFIEQLINFYTKRIFPDKFFSYLLVGTIGVLVHLTLLNLFLFNLTLDFSHALIATTFISIVSNFILNNILTFRRHRLFGWLWLKGLFFYLLICSCGALANIGIADYLYINGKLWWISALAGLALGAVFNFSLSRFFVWRS